MPAFLFDSPPLFYRMRRLFFGSARSLTSVRGKYGKKRNVEERRDISGRPRKRPDRNRPRKGTAAPMPKNGNRAGKFFRKKKSKILRIRRGGEVRPRSAAALRVSCRRRGRKAAPFPQGEAHVGHVYGTERIPWPIRPKKGAEDCEKPGGAVNGRYHPGMPEWGNPSRKTLDVLVRTDTRRIEISQ